MEEETCDWCALEFELTDHEPYFVGFDEICIVCYLAVFNAMSQPAQEDSPPHA